MAPINSPEAGLLPWRLMGAVRQPFFLTPAFELMVKAAKTWRAPKIWRNNLSLAGRFFPKYPLTGSGRKGSLKPEQRSL